MPGVARCTLLLAATVLAVVEPRQVAVAPERREISTIVQFEQILHDDKAWMLYLTSGSDDRCEEFEKSYQILAESLQRVHIAVIDIDASREAKEIADLMGAIDEGLPNLKLLLHSNAALPMMSGNKPRSVKRIRKELKKNLLQLTKNDDGIFFKSQGKAPSDFLFELNAEPVNDDTICYEVSSSGGSSRACPIYLPGSRAFKKRRTFLQHPGILHP
jgi:hypothetical protein